MNGNFEIDKGAYPYTATRIGDHTYVLHTPTLEKCVTFPLPRAVAERVALQANTVYHSRVQTPGPVTPLPWKELVAASLTACLGDGVITGPVFQQLKDINNA